ncbi:30S ribosome-binding factor RbfA [Akkermansia glycaniphila]|uniref:Ribosome-binding factor A n=1 Tax=Akkermansia glycaniphila TaxID=1679444 RepID=A0A1H6MKS1_9BACT|nr:30S ribosome-binding factor RbfA [Akkermansia glycaniphila]SEH98192.1 k homology domain-like alpha/beta [Akkermansia glycaniphila]
MSARRLDKVNELMRREISSVIQKEFDWHGTIISVLEVSITEDLKEGKVWIGIVGAMPPAQVIEKLNKNRGLIQSIVSKRVVLRCTPRLNFLYDDSARRGVDLVNLIDDIDKNLPKAPPAPEGEEDIFR